MPDIKDIDFDNLDTFSESENNEGFEKTESEKTEQDQHDERNEQNSENLENNSSDEQDERNDEEESEDTLQQEGEGEDEESGEQEESEEKSEEESEETSEDERPIPQVVLENLGVEVDSEMEFEDTVDGIQSAFEYALEQKKNEELESVFDQYPDVKEYFQYRENGGTVEDFIKVYNPDNSYENVEFDENNTHMHEKIVRDLLEKKGFKHIDDRISNMKNTGILKQEAQYGLEELQEIEKTEKDQLIAEQDQKRQQQEEQIKEFWNGVKQTIDKGEPLGDIQIPKSERDNFFKYISQPKKDGYSQRDLDAHNLPMEKKILVDYLLYKDFDLSKIIDKKAQTNNAKKLRDQINSKKEKGVKSKESKQVDTKGSKEIDFSNI